MSDYDKPYQLNIYPPHLKTDTTGRLISAEEAKSLVATKHDQGKAKMSLVPSKALEEIAHVFTFGAAKYSADNWRSGLGYRRLLDALLRHVNAFNRGEDLDPESGRSHLAHAGCCVMMLLEQVVENKTDLDDRYKP